MRKKHRNVRPIHHIRLNNHTLCGIRWHAGFDKDAKPNSRECRRCKRSGDR